jgi:hypothetical protein
VWAHIALALHVALADQKSFGMKQFHRRLALGHPIGYTL